MMQKTGRDKRRESSVGRNFARIALSDIYTGSENRRTEESSLLLLTASIARHGLLQPLIVRENSEFGRYRLISGYRRLMACRAAGLEYVDAIILTCSEQEAAACYMEEHLTREVQPVVSDARMLARIGKESVEESFALPGVLLDDRIQLLDLPETVLAEIEKNRLSVDQAKPVLRIRDPMRQMEAVFIITERALGAEQAKRLVCGRQNEPVRKGKRRHAALVVDTINRAVEGLRRRGIPLQVQMHTQEGGVCICIMMKNTAGQPAQEGKTE